MKNLVICVVMVFTMVSGMFTGAVREQNNHEWDSEMETAVQESYVEAEDWGYEDYSVEYEHMYGSKYYLHISFTADGEDFDGAFVYDCEEGNCTEVLYARCDDEWRYDWD